MSPENEWLVQMYFHVFPIEIVPTFIGGHSSVFGGVSDLGVSDAFLFITLAAGFVDVTKIL